MVEKKGCGTINALAVVNSFHFSDLDTYICVRNEVNYDVPPAARSQSTGGGVKGCRAQFSVFSLQLTLIKKKNTVYNLQLLKCKEVK